jgi:hypothetical protein
MFRRRFIDNRVGYEKDFRWRGGQVSRTEGFSDAVFAFSVTLLVVSLEVPKTFTDLMNTMRGFVAFGICFAILIHLWYTHYIYFRRYALNDTYTIVLNAALLFVVLFYIYPLKFLFTLLVSAIFGTGQPSAPAWTILGPGDGSTLMIVYNIGYMTVFLIFALMYFHAHRKKDDLRLNTVELFETRSGIHKSLINITVPLISTSIVLAGGDQYAAWAGWSYFLLGPSLAVHGTIRGKRKGQLRLQMESQRRQGQMQQQRQHPQQQQRHQQNRPQHRRPPHQQRGPRPPQPPNEGEQ